MARTPPTLDTLPEELLLQTLTYLPLDAIAAFSQVSVHASLLVYGEGNDGSLWRSLYLDAFDDPRESGWKLRPPPSSDTATARAKRLALNEEDNKFNWRDNARTNMTALREWQAGRLDLIRGEADEVDLLYRALLNMITTAPSAGTPSLNLPKLVSALPSSLATILTIPTQTRPVFHQLLTHLMPHPLPKLARPYGNALTEARETVYSLAKARNPLETADGTIDWASVHGLSVVMHSLMTRAMAGEVWDPEGMGEVPWPWTAEQARPPRLSTKVWESEEKDDWDWAGVGGGEWVGAYAFIDYADYVHFNYPEMTRTRGKPSLSGVDEACGDLMHLNLVPTCARPSTSSSTLPRIHFSGTSSSPVPSTVKGSARLSPDGQVRVTYVIAYGGTDRWRLEGIHVGGIGARRGVVGIWTEADPGQHSPSGPFFFWKA